jgi:hypothetical protein
MPMISVESGSCESCGGAAIVLCDGCGRALCERCRVFDIWCYGCGHGDTKAFCRPCYDNPDVNIWKGR